MKTKITEKFDSDGKLIERITETEGDPNPVPVPTPVGNPLTYPPFYPSYPHPTIFPPYSQPNAPTHPYPGSTGPYIGDSYPPAVTVSPFDGTITKWTSTTGGVPPPIAQFVTGTAIGGQK